MDKWDELHKDLFEKKCNVASPLQEALKEIRVQIDERNEAVQKETEAINKLVSLCDNVARIEKEIPLLDSSIKKEGSILAGAIQKASEEIPHEELKKRIVKAVLGIVRIELGEKDIS